MAWTAQKVLALAPDAAAARAAQGLASVRSWSGLGRDERAVWGLCRGSGARPYETQVDLAAPAFRCSCPSRKVPCKHALALLLLRTSSDEVPEGERPQWVDEWLASRDRRAARADAREERPAPPPDPEQQARRVARREARVAGGVEELRRWLSDLVRRGLAQAQREPWHFWDGTAARMVDAQAGGLASRVRRLGAAAHGGDAWAERLLEEAALLHLLLEAYGRGDELPQATAADVRQLIGWSVPTADVLAGERLRDRWAVAGQVLTEDERLRSLRTWLLGEGTGVQALVLQFGPPGAPLDPGVAPGVAVDASLALYPGTAPRRALVAELHGAPEPLERLRGHASVTGALEARAVMLARNPWLDRFPAALVGVVPARDGAGWSVADDAGDGLPLRRRREWWALAALSGGAPIDVFGELDGETLTPLGAVAGGRAVALA